MENDLHPPVGIIQTYDCGLGTTYERWALNRFLENRFKKAHFHSVLEGPDDGMTGIYGLNSLMLGRMGMEVTLAFRDPAKAEFAKSTWQHYVSPEQLPTLQILNENQDLSDLDRKFDLVWNFNVVNRLPDPEACLQQMCNLSKDLVLIFVPNARNYSFFLHRLQHKVNKKPWDHGSPEWLEAKPYRRILSDMGLDVIDEVWVDCPWWPDIVDLGELIADFFPFLKRLAKRAKPENRLLWQANALPYYDSIKYKKIHQQMNRLAFFERSPFSWLNKTFAHHIGILAKKRSA
jgi:hypothetical protein